MRERMRAWRRQISRLARPRAPEPLPMTLGRRRIYVLPTRFGWFVAALLLTMLVGALNYNNNPALLLALLLGAAGIASTIMAHLQLSALRVEAVSAEPVAAGEPLRLRISLSRRDTRARRGLQLRHEDSHGTCSLVDDHHAEADLAVPTTQRGWRDLDRIRISSTQPLGLVRAWSWVWPEALPLVYPRPESDGPPLPGGAGHPVQTRLHALGEELHQLRPYRPGDAPRTIAWKHSARRDTLLVREYERPVGVEVLLDWRTLAPLSPEQRIARLARWVNDAERDGRRYRLLLPGQPVLGPAHGSGHRHQCLRALALLPHA